MLRMTKSSSFEIRLPSQKAMNQLLKPAFFCFLVWNFRFWLVRVLGFWYYPNEMVAIVRHWYLSRCFQFGKREKKFQKIDKKGNWLQTPKRIWSNHPLTFFKTGYWKTIRVRCSMYVVKIHYFILEKVCIFIAYIMPRPTSNLICFPWIPNYWISHSNIMKYLSSTKRWKDMMMLSIDMYHSFHIM